MTERITGSIEVKRGGESIGVVGVSWDPATVPVVLETLYGITGLESSTPIAAPTGRVPAHQWTGIDSDHQSVDVMLWPDVPFDETAIGQAIAGALAEGGGV